MRITSLRLQNFKRFTDLQIDSIPESAKLVLLIGANGSGKSSVFDAMYLCKERNDERVDDEYYLKQTKELFTVEISLDNGRKISSMPGSYGQRLTSSNLGSHFFGRSSNRIIPRISLEASPEKIKDDSDRPKTFIDPDTRLENDVFAYMQGIDDAIREPIFSGRQVNILQIFQEFIEPFNSSLRNIFGEDLTTTIQVARYQNPRPSVSGQLIFKKGNTEINYDLLSHGEKQVITLLLNFIVRKQYYEDAIIFIDEMDAHLNTALQEALLHEIVTRWIPDSAQFWTASHALGFISYARKSDEAVTIDFDALDFDQPQVLKPAPKENFDVFEIAVSKELLGELFEDRSIVFAENTDTALYNNLSIQPYVFFKSLDKLDVFHKANHLNTLGLIDRDYLSDEERDAVLASYPRMRILPYYSSENLLCHPDNLEEYFSRKAVPFDKADYTSRLTLAKNEALPDLLVGLNQARAGYPFYKENERAVQLKAFKEGWSGVKQLLQSDDFEHFYKVFPAKDYGKTIPQRQNLAKTELANTDWFRKRISEALK